MSSDWSTNRDGLVFVKTKRQLARIAVTDVDGSPREPSVFLSSCEESSAAPTAHASPEAASTEGPLDDGPLVGSWIKGTFFTVISADALVYTFPFEGETREIHYRILGWDPVEQTLDLLKERVLQGGAEVDFEGAPEKYLAYELTDATLQWFIGPNPYPRAAAGQTYQRQETPYSNASGDAALEARFADLNDSPLVGSWIKGTFFTVISADALVYTFPFEGETREIHYRILGWDPVEQTLDLLKERVLQGGAEVDFEGAPEKYLAYELTDATLQWFIGPNPYPRAAAGQTYQRQETPYSNASGDAALEARFADLNDSPLVGSWIKGTFFTVISADALVYTFPFEGETREIHYRILGWDPVEQTLDLLKERVLQGGAEVDFEGAPEKYLAYELTDATLQWFIGPNPYPRAAAGQTYQRQEDAAFQARFADIHPCGNWPNYAAFEVVNLGGQAFESSRLIVMKAETPPPGLIDRNQRPFTPEGGCPPGEESLEPGAAAFVGRNIMQPTPGTALIAYITLCTDNEARQDCVLRTVEFEFDG